MFFVPNGLRGAAAALLVCAACATSGQVSFVHMEHIAADNGFPSHVVWKCVSDPMGFMWFATEEGLHRWDGVEYLSFRSDITDTSAFEGRTFFDLVLDRAGFLWTITRNTLVRIDPKTLEIRKWEHRPAGFKTNSKNVQRIIRICSDKKDRLWVGTTYGFFVLDEMKKPLRYIEVPAADNEDFGNVTGMTMDDDGNLWSTSLSGVTCIDGRDFSLRHYKLDGDIPGGAITFWQGTIWVGAEKLYSYDKTNDGFVVSGPEGYGGIVPYQFESSHPAGDTLWIAFRGSGLASYVRSENKFIRWSADAKRQSTLPSFVFSIFRKDDCLWLCSGDGVFRFFPQRQSFRRIGVNEIAAEEDMTIYNLFPDTYAAEEGWLYISASTGLYHWNHITGTTESIPWPLKEDGSMLKYPNFFSIDSQGNWWWSMGYEGVYKCNEGKAELILSDEEVEPGTRDYLWYMSTVDEDSKGRIWIAAESKLACYEEGKISMFTPQPVISAAGDTLMPKPSFGSFVFDRDENIWLVSDFSYQKHVIALVRFNVETKAFDYFYHDGNSNFPNVDNIHQVSVVGDNIWCAAEGGVLYFKPTATGSPEFHVVGYNAGMNSLHCQGIKGDSAGNVWVSGFGGIFSVSPSGKLTKYGVSDGLIRQKLPVHFVGLKDGTLLFHTTWEITAFDPVGLWPLREAPSAQLTHFLVNNKPVANSVLHSLESPIKLSWWENDITLQWSALDFGTDRHVEYAYKLEGVDNDWIYAGFSNSVTYANLHGGDYTFRVRTRSGHSDWNETALRCDIIVRTAWFRSWWFFALVAFIAIGSLFALYRFRLRQLMKVQAVRNRLAGDLHDEVGSNLSSLVIYSDLVIAGAERGKVDVNIVQKMKDTSSQSLESMRDIVWSLNTVNDEFNVMLAHMKRAARDLVEPHNIQLKFEVGEALGKLRLSPEQRKNLYMVLKESVNNARKHAGASVIEVRFFMQGTQLVMTVSDNGRGFNPATPTSGNGLQNIRKRAEELSASLEIVSQPGKGTTISLSVPV